MKTLVILPIKPDMHHALQERTLSSLESLVEFCGRSVDVLIDRQPESTRFGDSTPWSKVTRVRNRILDSVRARDYSHFLWIDADIASFPRTLLQDLLSANSEGISAPTVLIEGSQTFYDWAAFILHNSSHISPEVRGPLAGRNIDSSPPYVEGTERIVQMDCVGAVTLVNTEIYRAGARYSDHPNFTDHFTVAEACRKLGRPVTFDRETLVYHAVLPDYGEAWH